MRTDHARGIVVMLACCLMAHPAAAQLKVAVGDSIRFMERGIADPARSAVVLASNTPDSLVFVEDGARRSVAVRRLASLDVWHDANGRTEVRRGVIAGAIAGVIAGGLMGTSMFGPPSCPATGQIVGQPSADCSTGEVSRRLQGAAVGALFGSIVGLFVGSAIPGRWEPVSLDVRVDAP